MLAVRVVMETVVPQEEVEGAKEPDRRTDEHFDTWSLHFSCSSLLEMLTLPFVFVEFFCCHFVARFGDEFDDTYHRTEKRGVNSHVGRRNPLLAPGHSKQQQSLLPSFFCLLGGVSICRRNSASKR